MAPRFRPSGWAGRDARLVGTRPRVRGCPRWCWHFCSLPALSRRSGDVGSLPPPRSSEIEATHPHVKCRTGACRWARPPHATGAGTPLRQGELRRCTHCRLASVYSAPSIRPRTRRHACPDARANPLALAVLACLTERPMHPYEMAATMRTRGQDASIRLNYGSLYGVVETLLKRGLIEEQEVVREGRRPERTVYRITDDGRAEVDDWMAELLGHVGQGVPAVRGRALAHGRAPARAGRRAARPAGRRSCRSGSRSSTRSSTPRRGNGVPRLFLVGDGLRARAGRRRLRVHRTVRARRSSRNRLDGVAFWKSFHADREHDEAAEEQEHMNAIVEVEGIARSFGDTQALARRRPRRCPRAAWSRCSGRTARARPRSCASCRP